MKGTRKYYFQVNAPGVSIDTKWHKDKVEKFQRHKEEENFFKNKGVSKSSN